MNIHEYQGKKLLSSVQIPVPVSILATNPLDCVKAFDLYGPIVIKAQVHSGGRGKAGGVMLVKSAEEAFRVGSSLLGSTLVTNQTGGRGLKVTKLLCEPIAQIKQEMYLSMTLDRKQAEVIVIFSATGGVEIEKLSKENTSAIRQVRVHPLIGFTPGMFSILLGGLNFSGNLINQLVDILQKCLNLFFAKDLSLLEINPLAIVDSDLVVALDCKIAVDDNALFRHPELRALDDYTQYDPVELNAKRKGLSYISLDGNIGCLVNGAGLAMATMDSIKMNGGNPANFLDIGGGVSEEGVDQAMKLLLEDEKVKAIFVNIFGGIVKCDLVAGSIVKAYRDSATRKPAVIRLLGTNSELAKDILNRSEFRFQMAETMDEGAKQVIQMVN